LQEGQIETGSVHWLSRLKHNLSLARVCDHMLFPRVGILEQHPPRPLYIPLRYLNNTRARVNNKLKISIVTPSLNQAEFVGRTIKSVLDQGYSNLEYIVQDGDSKDGSLDIIKSFQQELAYFESHRDNGQAQAINIGFRRTTGEIMAPCRM
jgi:cellulose synthase/poly-beta-1,6-N-acetylglucosamine synthase-like glycosyltransferase